MQNTNLLTIIFSYMEPHAIIPFMLSLQKPFQISYNASHQTSTIEILNYMHHRCPSIILTGLTIKNTNTLFQFPLEKLEQASLSYTNPNLRQLQHVKKLTLNCLTTNNLSNLQNHYKLEHLTLINIDNIEPLPYFPNLTHLILQKCNKLANINALTNLPNLKRLYITSDNLIDITPISTLNLTHLTLSCLSTNLDPINNLQNLQHLTITNCPNLTAINWSPVPKPNLKSFKLWFCPNLTTISNLTTCLNLHKFYTAFCPIHNICHILNTLKKLHDVSLAHVHNWNQLENLPNLHHIFLHTIPFDITSIITNLTHLILFESPIIHFEYFPAYTNLNTLELINCPDLTTIVITDFPNQSINLKKLIIENCDLANTHNLSSFSQLEYLKLKLLHRITSIKHINKLKKLITLKLYELTNLKTLPDLSSCSNLETLIIKNNEYIRHINTLIYCPNLKNLHLLNCYKLTTLPSLPTIFPTLKYIRYNDQNISNTSNLFIRRVPKN